ncbi:hypothetical protein Rumeso_00563 [Rubellimicrobium mesophilum DSM 19309]|uniref:Cupin type-1 domain-containing protein n=2 Tax=Rubellimicrobium TaxID=295418 RepID=A0A017HTW3_9RHOB|nr:hypothetical protein Rumeso_00563 [Rubellimicrobium mesophilum DSM 19309]
MDQPEPHHLPPSTPFPNSPLPLLVYHDALPSDPAAVESLFARHGWTAAWVNGVYPFHHWHSSAHEVLGCTRGQARLRLGGPEGLLLDAIPGTVLVIPAGVAHCNEGSSPDFQVVGATDGGRDYDIVRGAPTARQRENLATLPLPKSDPVHGPGGPLPRLWRT